MSTRSERDRQKSLQERHQNILGQLLKEEDNKYCVDCDAKGPRWASWNLGIFLCIRCAGIHRNLGVHISKVKSVNLDTWTPEQVAMMQEMGNSRARAVYEANIPDHFRRPQTDSALEAFIRAKYEQKKYIAKEWVPPQPKVQPVIEEKKEKKRNRPRPASSGIQLSGPSRPSPSSSPVHRPKVDTTPVVNNTPAPAKVEPKKESNIDDLLGLDTPAVGSNSDPFSDFVSASSQPAASSATTQASTESASTNPTQSSSSEASELFGENSGSGEAKKSTKESILALYGNSSNQQQMFGVPGGMYMPQQPMNMQNGMMGPQQNGMMGQQQNGMMGQQQNSMMGQQQNGMMGQQQNGMMGQQQNSMMGQQQNGMMGVPASMAGMMPGNTGGNMMAGGMQANMMMGNMNMAGGAANMYNMQGQMYGMNPQVQQMQNQMAAMNLGGANMAGAGYGAQVGGMTQPPVQANTWATPQTGQTLSTNLWQ